MKPSFIRSRGSSMPPNKKPAAKPSSVPNSTESALPEDSPTRERVLALQTEVATLKKQFERLRHTSADEIKLLRNQSEEWSNWAE